MSNFENNHPFDQPPTERYTPVDPAILGETEFEEFLRVNDIDTDGPAGSGRPFLQAEGDNASAEQNLHASFFDSANNVEERGAGLVNFDGLAEPAYSASNATPAQFQAFLRAHQTQGQSSAYQQAPAHLAYPEPDATPTQAFPYYLRAQGQGQVYHQVPLHQPGTGNAGYVQPRVVQTTIAEYSTPIADVYDPEIDLWYNHAPVQGPPAFYSNATGWHFVVKKGPRFNHYQPISSAIPPSAVSSVGNVTSRYGYPPPPPMPLAVQQQRTAQLAIPQPRRDSDSSSVPQKRSRKQTRQDSIERMCTCPKPEHVKRPPNAFIMYRNDIAHKQTIMNEKLKRQGKKKEMFDMQDVSKSAGAMWRNESKEIKDRWYAQADKAKKDHKARYPDYQFRPGTKNSGFGTPACTCGAYNANMARKEAKENHGKRFAEEVSDENDEFDAEEYRQFLQSRKRQRAHQKEVEAGPAQRPRRTATKQVSYVEQSAEEDESALEDIPYESVELPSPFPDQPQDDGLASPVPEQPLPDVPAFNTRSRSRSTSVPAVEQTTSKETSVLSSGDNFSQEFNETSDEISNETSNELANDFNGEFTGDFNGEFNEYFYDEFINGMSDNWDFDQVLNASGGGDPIGSRKSSGAAATSSSSSRRSSGGKATRRSPRLKNKENGSK